ncbi:SLC13 family permease [Mastigocoleus testarum]|uniref:Transporter n=1 Tax=Mastigocoleus testarum BC008 TaxID=371196 RepID=A0A0V7ZLM5_9CYAN|nr:SLC13 family permease [Mastigocoleus testarum]KST65356.1 transporter [Mastigocoleus testarum BC008]KST70420.1 transporter [Mastigocoleus testarum BC008]
MTILLTLAIVVLALILFVAEWLPSDIVAIITTLLLTIFGLVTPEESISGFSNSATITVMAMFILSAGIGRTGAIQIVSELLLRWGGKRPSQQIFTLGLIVGPTTAFINNTAVVAVFLPIVEEWCRRQRISVSKLLIPLSFAAILGGMITAIGTSTNVLASGLAQQLGYRSFNLFEFTKLGLVTFTVGLIYLALVAPRLLPNRKKHTDEIFNQKQGIKDYVSEILIPPGSSLVGETLNSSILKHKLDVDVLEIIADDTHLSQPLENKKLQACSVLLVRSSREDLLKIKDEEGIEILPEFIRNKKFLQTQLTSEDEGIAEILITSNSNLIGSTVKEINFRQRYNVTVLAVHRGEETTRERLTQIRLKFGDVLLVQGPKPSLLGLQINRNLLVLTQRNLETLRRDKASIAIGIGLGVVVVAAFNWLPILISSLVGVVLMVLTGCLKPREIYDAVRWDIIFLLAGLIPLGIAMDRSGATQWLANNLVAIGGNLSGYWILTFFFIITSILTEMISNNAAVVLMLPIAANVAEKLSFNPFAFMLAVVFAASNSFITPIGYQTNTMVYGAGGYKFTDFMRVGTPLNLLMTVVVPPLIIFFYGL